MNVKTVLVITCALACVVCAFGQTTESPPAVSAQPSYFVTLGAGFNQYSNPHYAATGSFGLKIGDGLYSLTSLDSGTTYDATARTRVLVSTLRTGVMKLITTQGPVSISALGDAGLQAGGSATVGSFSAGGVLAYTFKRQPNAFAFAAVRVVKTPQSVPDANGGTQVQPAFTFGVGWRFN